MSEKLTIKPGQSEEQLAIVPRGREELEASIRYREALATNTLASAQKINGRLREDNASVEVPLGTQDGNDPRALKARISRIPGLGDTLRVTVEVGDKPEATFAYKGDIRTLQGKPPTYVIEETPGTTKAGLDKRYPRDADNIRTLDLQAGNGGHIYSDYNSNPEIFDRGAMDFQLVSAVLATAAEQVAPQEMQQPAA